MSHGLVIIAAVSLSSQEGHLALVRAGGLRVAVQSMQCHESEVGVQRVGLRLLAAMSSWPESAKPMLKEGGMHLLLHGLRVHASEDATTAAAACLMLARLAKGELAAESAAALDHDWEVLCEQVVTSYGATYSIAEHVAQAVPVLRQHFYAPQ